MTQLLYDGFILALRRGEAGLPMLLGMRMRLVEPVVRVAPCNLRWRVAIKTESSPT